MITMADMPREERKSGVNGPIRSGPEGHSMNPNNAFKLRKTGQHASTSLLEFDRSHRVSLVCRNCSRRVDLYITARVPRELSDIECHCGNRDWSWKTVW